MGIICTTFNTVKSVNVTAQIPQGKGNYTLRVYDGYPSAKTGAQMIGKYENLSAGSTLNKIVNWCNKYPSKRISIKGYADKGTGNPKINVGYAKARAEKVAKALEEKGISKSRMDVESFGDTVQPFPENDRNRCVIVVGE